jgi:hypothetical protein
MKSDRRAEFVTLNEPHNEHTCHCQKQQGLSIAKQKFWYTISSVLVLCLLLLSTALVLKSGNECEHNHGPEARILAMTPSIPAKAVPCIPQEVCPRGRKGKKCRELQKSQSASSTTTEPAMIEQKLAPKLIGKYKQTEMVNMEAYLEAEGGSYFFRKMALKVYPNLEIKEYEDQGHYGQIYTAPLYNKEWPMYTTGVEYEQEDGLGTKVTATATDNGSDITIMAKGGKSGPMITKMYFETVDGIEKLKMEISLPDKNVTGVRIFERQN